MEAIMLVQVALANELCPIENIHFLIFHWFIELCIMATGSFNDRRFSRVSLGL